MGPRAGQKFLERRKISCSKHCHYTNYSILALVSRGTWEKHTFTI